MINEQMISNFHSFDFSIHDDDDGDSLICVKTNSIYITNTCSHIHQKYQ